MPRRVKVLDRVKRLANGTRAPYSYDTTYQLTREQRNGANNYDLAYTYDGAGSRMLEENNAT